MALNQFLWPQENDSAVIQSVLNGQYAFSLPDGHFIDGEYTRASTNSERVLNSYDPGSGLVFSRFSRGSIDDINDAVLSAKNTFEQSWRGFSGAKRGAILLAIAALIRQHASALALIETLDCGKPLNEAQGDVMGAARCFEYYAGACDKLQGDTYPLGQGYLSYSEPEPIGVVGQIIPWNFPLSTFARGVAPALAAGCCVVAKPAEQTPFTALLMGQLMHQAGLPAGACNIVTGLGAEAGSALVESPLVRHITFTGSFATGVSVMQSAANDVKRVVLELGGKSPVVVLADADIEAALDGVQGAIFEHAGQICSAGSRLIIQRSIHQQFIERLIERVSKMSIGHGLCQPGLGPVNSKAQLDKINQAVCVAKSAGANIVQGGNVHTPDGFSHGWYFEPTIIDQCASDVAWIKEEIFGPVLCVQIADSPEEALALANDNRYGLAAGVYTQDISLAHQFAKHLDVGQVYINEYFAGGIEVPFGGNKHSGFGREKGLEGLLSYCKTKAVTVKL